MPNVIGKPDKVNPDGAEDSSEEEKSCEEGHSSEPVTNSLLKEELLHSNLTMYSPMTQYQEASHHPLHFTSLHFTSPYPSPDLVQRQEAEDSAQRLGE